MTEKDASTIPLQVAHGRLNSDDRYKGRPVSPVIGVALDALNDLEREIAHLKYLLRQKK